MKSLRRFDINVGLKIILLFGFAAFFFFTIISGTVILYVHPRVIPFMIFASISMILIGILLFRDLFNSSEKKVNSWPLLFFIVPLLMGFALPAKSFDSSSGAIGSVQLSSVGSVSSNTSSGNTSESTQDLKDSQNVAEINSAADHRNISQDNETNDSISLKNGILVLDSNNFYKCLCEIFDNMDKYKGTSIEVVGFVFKDNESFTKNQFVPARLMMVCCAADMQPVGILCQYDKASDLESDSWVKVNGTLDETTFEGETIPCIVAQSVEIAEDPDEAYVYPY